MYFEQFYLGCLAQASYMIGSEGVAVVVDPQRDVDFYIEEAGKNGFKIAHIIETHIHADFVSGHKELADRTGAKIYIGARASAQVAHVAVKEGDEVRFGRTVLRFLETPGHTPGCISTLVTDLDHSEEPWAVLTGDTLFIGEVGRPDLVPSTTPQEMAGALYDSLHQKLLTLPDNVVVYPAHGAGSLCGANIGKERFSTIGEQRASNYALQPMSRDDFVEMLTRAMPLRPEYFFRDAAINSAGAVALSALPPLPSLTPDDVESKQGSGAIILDTRTAAEFGVAHIPSAINIPLQGQFAQWAGTVIGLDAGIILVSTDTGADPERIAEARMRLARVGVENVIGTLDGGVDAWRQAGKPLARVQQISVEELSALLADPASGIQLVDVREPGEWAAGHIEGALHHKLGGLPSPAVTGENLQSVDDIDPSRPVAVQCAGGFRSAIGCSLLAAAGFDNLLNVGGGFGAWEKAKLPVEKPATLAT